MLTLATRSLQYLSWANYSTFIEQVAQVIDVCHPKKPSLCPRLRSGWGVVVPPPPTLQ